MDNKQKGVKVAWIGFLGVVLAAIITATFSIVNTNINTTKENKKSDDNLSKKQIEISEVQGDFVQGDKIINEYKTESTLKEDLSEGNINIEHISNLSGFSTKGYQIARKFKLNEFSNGINGALLLLIDNNIPELKGDIKRYGSYPPVTLYPEFRPYEDFDPFDTDYSNVRKAVLLIVNHKLQILYTEDLGHQFARVDRVFLYKQRNKPTFIVTTNFGHGWGSYNGPYSKFIEINKNGIEYILEGGLSCTLKSHWWISKSDGNNTIYEKSCFPRGDGKEDTDGNLIFEITIKKYFYENSKWKKLVSKEDGFWESEGFSSL